MNEIMYKQLNGSTVLIKINDYWFVTETTAGDTIGCSEWSKSEYDGFYAPNGAEEIYKAHNWAAESPDGWEVWDFVSEPDKFGNGAKLEVRDYPAYQGNL